MASPCSTPVPAGCTPANIGGRVLEDFTRRFNAAKKWATPAPAQPNNGDITIADYCASYSKAVQQDSPGKVNPAAFQLLQQAVQAEDFNAFNAVPLGNMNNPDGRLNGPMGAYAYAFLGPDCSQFVTSQLPPKLDSDEYATELIELYWCSLLRDVPFSAYHRDPLAIEAAQELSTAAAYQGPKHNNKVTPDLLFRGTFFGETEGPHLSQFLIQPTNFGSLPVDQKYTTYAPGVDYMTDETSWFQVQQGQATGKANVVDPALRYLYNGRGLAAWTHVDELYQAYFTAHLVLEAMKAYNPQSPYPATGGSQKPFGTFGPADIAAVLAQVAKYALSAVWYQKWAVHLRHRPEAGAGLYHWKKVHGTAYAAYPKLNRLDNSPGVKASFDKYGTYLLSQTFPEGSPTHPAYPTGHGAVGGACITVLKFFYNGDLVLPGPVVPTEDGLGRVGWIGQPGTGALTKLTVNGELHKLAHNITFGHGLHGGIHWRSDSDESIRLGEQVALRFLQDLACTYAEPFKITLKLLDGVSTQTISNM